MNTRIQVPTVLIICSLADNVSCHNRPNHSDAFLRGLQQAWIESPARLWVRVTLDRPATYCLASRTRLGRFKSDNISAIDSGNSPG